MPARDYPRLSGPDAFAAWDEPGTVRVLFGHWVQERDDGRAELVSEARVEPVDRAAAVPLRRLWTVVGPFDMRPNQPGPPVRPCPIVY